MKTTVFHLLLFINFMLLYFVCFSQTTITLQPNAVDGKDSYIHNYNINQNLGYHDDFAAISWTNSGTPYNARCLLEFDISSIPQNATVINAFLSLYFNPTSSNGNHSGDNNCWLERITADWQENTVTWNNQPTTTTQNRVSLPASISSDQDYENIDIKYLIQDIINDTANSHGIMIKLKTEEIYRRLTFSSSDHIDSTLHPKLVITYLEDTTAQTCITLKPDSQEGIDAYIHEYDINQNLGTHPDFAAIAWTNSGTPYIARNLIDFGLSSIPNNAIVTYAGLSLFYNPTSPNGPHSGSNECWLERITEPWTELNVTWSNQPTTTIQNRVSIPQSISSDQDYPNIDITLLIQDILYDPANSYGLMLKLKDEQIYNRLTFSSSDNADSTLYPELMICYTINEGQNEITKNNFVFEIYPNPAYGSLNIELNSMVNQLNKIEIFNLQGEMIYSNDFEGLFYNLNLSGLCKGLYLIKVSNDYEICCKKLIYK
ncbi:MAG: DNRLRE domain-containing protein [Bacteroidota bacterium]